MKKSQFLKLKGILIESIILSILFIVVIREIDRELILKVLYPIEIPIFSPFNYFGVFLAVIVFNFIVWANYILLYVNKIGLKDREPFHIPSSLALTGPHKFSRNPIYFGLILMVLGVFVLIHSITILIVEILLFLLFRYSFIRWEEKKLEEEYGLNYLDFKAKVRRWI